MKGATPSQSMTVRRLSVKLGMVAMGRSTLRLAESLPAVSGGKGHALEPSLLDVRADRGAPLLGNDFLRGGLFFKAREDGFLVGGRRRHLVEQFLRDLAVLGEIVEADRVAIALQPAKLAFVRIKMLHPQLGGVRMRRMGGDRLDVDA